MRRYRIRYRMRIHQIKEQVSNLTIKIQIRAKAMARCMAAAYGMAGLFLALILAFSPASAAPKMGIMHWPQEDHPIWGPRLEKALRDVVDADTAFGGVVALEAIAAREHITLGSSQFLGGAGKTLAPVFGIDVWVRLELAHEVPEHKITRHTWMPWKSTETWALPLRLTVWDGASGKISYSGLVPGDTTKAANRFWPYRSYESFNFFEKESKRAFLVERAVLAARDTLARIVLTQTRYRPSK
jgi:hypothetical protein